MNNNDQAMQRCEEDRERKETDPVWHDEPDVEDE